MAGCSKGQIGALNAESFCERVLSVANLVVTDGNTVLKDSSVTKLTILRINRKFMEYMRANYNAASRQKFKTTIVDVKGQVDGKAQVDGKVSSAVSLKSVWGGSPRG